MARVIPYEAELPISAPRSLWPREHGVYVQLLAPLLAVMLTTSPSAASVAMAIATCAGFLGTEAVVIAKGGRGTRRQHTDGQRAARRARACAVVVATTGCLALVIAPRAAVELAGLVALPVALSLLLATRRSIHSLGGELLVAITLAGAAAPVGAAAGMARTDALAMWAAWAIGLSSGVIAVRVVLARHRKHEGWLGPVSVLGLAAFAAWLLAVPDLAAALPMVVTSGVVIAANPSAKHLTAIGVMLAIAAAASVAMSVGW